MSEKKDSSPIDNEKQLYKIVKDFVRDILITFPECKELLTQGIIDITLDNLETDDAKSVYKYCEKYYPDKFFDILYEKDELISGDDSYFLPNIQFSKLWKEDITDRTRQTIWKYLQLILFSVVQNSEENFFGDNTSKLFEAINQDEFKGKLEETLNDMQNIFDLSNIDLSDMADISGISQENLPDVDELHSNINSMLDGKIGRLAKEIAEETTEELNIEMDDAQSINDVFEKLFKNPTKLMGLVKSVGTKLDTKIKKGDIKESELIEEAQEMVEKMQSIPGMGNMQDLLNKMGMGGGKVNMSAMKSQMGQNLRQAKMKERMQQKLAERQKQKEEQEKGNLKPSENGSIFSTGEVVEKTPRKSNNKKKNKNKNKKKKKKINK